MNPFRQGTYMGPVEALKGKTALLRIIDGEVWAQFDDIDTGLGYGWHLLPGSEWEVTMSFKAESHTQDK